MTRAHYADATTLHLAQLRPGQVRTVRLRLMEIREHDKRPTAFFLDLAITCDVQGRRFPIEVKADFGEMVPRRATVTIAAGRGAAPAPQPLVVDCIGKTASLTLDLDPAAEWLTLWVSTESEGVPSQLAGEVRLRRPEDERPAEQLETARLPSLKLVVRQSLMGALQKSASPILVQLGGLMRCEEAEEKRLLLRQLIELGADLRLVEAGVRDIALCEQIVRGFRAMRFERLDLADVPDMLVAIFHPGAPLPMVRQAFALAFEAQLSAPAPEQVAGWQALAKAAAVVVCRKDRALLDESFAVATGIASDTSRQARFHALVEWASQHANPVSTPLSAPLEIYLGRIGGDVQVVAERAAVDVLAHYDLISVSVPLA